MQRSEQNRYVTPSCSQAATACSRSTSMPHTGSVSIPTVYTPWGYLTGASSLVRTDVLAWPLGRSSGPGAGVCSAHGGRRNPHHVSTRVATTPHGALGLTTEDLLAMYRTVLTARLLDEAALRQNRMGRAPFVVPAEGHEACQVGTAWVMRKGVDVWVPYYRDGAVVLAAGMTPFEIFLGIFAKAD